VENLSVATPGTRYARSFIVMSLGSQHHPTLRLVDTAVADALRPLPRDNVPVPSTKRPDTPVPATDARWVLAARTAAMLAGGRAAVLNPDHRHRLLRLGMHLGLRPFDANLVIATVQDEARLGSGPLGPRLAERLRVIRPADARRPPLAEMPRVLWALGLGGAITLTLIAWTLYG